MGKEPVIDPKDKNNGATAQQDRIQLLIGKLKLLFTSVSTTAQNTASIHNSVCDMLYEVYHPLAVIIDINTKNGRLFSPGLHYPKTIFDDHGQPRSCELCRKVVDTGSPLIINTMDRIDLFPKDSFIKLFNLKTYLGIPIMDSRGKTWGALIMLDTESHPMDILDVELLTLATLILAERLHIEEQQENRKELEEHLQRAQKMEAVGMLAGGIAHDFNNILSGILGFTSYLMSKTQPDTDMHRDLGLIEQSALRAADLTRQLLAFARRRHFAKAPVDVNQVIEEVLGILSHSLPKNLVIEKDLPAGLSPVMGDHGQLNQVIMNICINAADSMSAQGGTLRVKAEHHMLTHREMALLNEPEKTEYLRLSISDTGPGMSAEVRKHIFDPFFTTKSSKGGSGLGLSIAYGIVSNHKGDIMVESVEGRGTTMRIYLPICEGETRKTEAAPSRRLEGTETIMVVDDESIVRQMVVDVLKSRGFQVIPAASGKEAVELYEQLKERVHLVLLDLLMPVMDGEATFHALQKINKQVCVLLTSGFARDEVSERLARQGARGMIHKPYKPDDLVGRIRSILDKQAPAK